MPADVPLFLSQDDAVSYWLQMGRTGTSEQQTTARTELGIILERRGQLDDAAAAYWENVKAGVADPRPYYRLAAICRLKGDDASAERILAKIAKPAAHVTPPMQPQPHRAAQPNAVQPIRRASRVPAALVAVVAVGCIGLLVLLAGGILVAATFAGVSTASCANVVSRFPAWNDPEGAVLKTLPPLQQQARQGLAPLGPSFDAWHRIYQFPADITVASWIMTSLYESHYGRRVALFATQNTAGDLADHVNRQVGWRSLRNVQLDAIRGRPVMRPMVSREEWALMESWPQTNCDGLLLKHPENARLVRLMRETVGDTSWDAR